MRIKSDYKDYYDFCAYLMPEDPKDSLWIRKHIIYENFHKIVPDVIREILEHQQRMQLCDGFAISETEQIHLGYLLIGNEVKKVLFKTQGNHNLWPRFPYRLSSPNIKVSIEEDMAIWDELIAKRQTTYNQYMTRNLDFTKYFESLEVNKKLGTCVTLLSQDVVHVNPPLIHLGYKEDPYQLYQHLEAFWDATFTPQPMLIPERSQELIRDAHGFDKHSFKHRK